MRIICSLLLLTGCEAWLDDTDVVGWTPDRGDTDVGTDTDLDTSVQDGCPDGMNEPFRSSVQVQSTVFDSLLLRLLPATEPWEGVPPICVSRDGLRVQALLVLAGEPHVWMRSETESIGSYALAGATGLELEFFGATPPVTFGPGDWSEGTWVVSDAREGFVHTVNGVAISDTRSLSIIAEVEVTP